MFHVKQLTAFIEGTPLAYDVPRETILLITLGITTVQPLYNYVFHGDKLGKLFPCPSLF